MRVHYLIGGSVDPISEEIISFAFLLFWFFSTSPIGMYTVQCWVWSTVIILICLGSGLCAWMNMEVGGGPDVPFRLTLNLSMIEDGQFCYLECDHCGMETIYIASILVCFSIWLLTLLKCHNTLLHYPSLPSNDLFSN